MPAPPRPASGPLSEPSKDRRVAQRRLAVHKRAQAAAADAEAAARRPVQGFGRRSVNDIKVCCARARARVARANVHTRSLTHAFACEHVLLPRASLRPQASLARGPETRERAAPPPGLARGRDNDAEKERLAFRNWIKPKSDAEQDALLAGTSYARAAAQVRLFARTHAWLLAPMCGTYVKALTCAHHPLVRAPAHPPVRLPTMALVHLPHSRSERPAPHVRRARRAPLVA